MAGAVIPVTSGVMRNIWHPKQMAEYLTATKAEDLGIKKDTPVEREYTFKSNEERKAIKQEERVAREILSEEKSVGIWEPASFSQAQDPVPQIELGLLTVSNPFSCYIYKAVLTMRQPGPASVILERTLPSFIEFWRTPIAVAPKRISPSIPTSSSVSVAEQDKPAGKTSIYGSVSTSDIAADLKAILADVEEASRVVLSAENIVFVEETEDKDRVKHLGVFEIEIRLDGAPDSIKRSIKVNALK